MLRSADLIGMFLLGLLGSGHCVGMCGPIALALGPRSDESRVLHRTLLYNLGRITTYVAIGATVAGLGSGMTHVLPLVRVQVWLTVLAGILLAWFGLALLRVLPEPALLRQVDGSRLPFVGTLLRTMVGGRNVMPALPLGLLLGFLPCGLSMAAFTRAISAERAMDGAVLVLAFGVGTLPAMMLLTGLAGRLGAKHRRAGELIAGVVMIAMAAQHLSRALAALM